VTIFIDGVAKQTFLISDFALKQRRLVKKTSRNSRIRKFECSQYCEHSKI